MLARRVFPADRTTYALGGNPTGGPSVAGFLGVPVGTTVYVYTDSLATIPADVKHADGSAVTFGNPLQIDGYSELPEFQGPDDDSTVLYVVVSAGPATAVYARYNDRIDELTTALDAADFLEASTTAASTSAQVFGVALANDLSSRFGILGDGTLVMGDAPVGVSNVTGTTTVTVTTSSNHGYGSGDVVVIAGVLGYVGANGTWTITRTGSATFTLNSATGSGTYTSGGKCQRRLGGTGSVNEGKFNFLVDDTTNYGVVIRGAEGNNKALLAVVDFGGNRVIEVLPAGGFGLESANPVDLIFATDDIFGRKFAANPRGGLRLAAGDPAGGVEVLAIGNTTTGPSANPDGTHLGEGSFTTVAGALLWAQDGRLLLRTSAGHQVDVAAPVQRPIRSVSAPGNGTTLDLDGTAAPTVATTNITASADDQTNGPFVKYLTTAAATVDAGVISAFGIIRPSWIPYFSGLIRTDASAITSTRLAVGLVSADIASNAGPASTGAFVVAQGGWFRFDTAVSDAGTWRLVTSNGTTATVTTSAIAIAVDSEYELAIEFNAAGTAVRFWINGVLAGTHSTNLPAASAALGYTARLRTLTTSARALRLGRLAWTRK